MTQKIGSPQVLLALFGAFAVAVLAFAQYRTSAMDSQRRNQLAKVLKMQDERPSWTDIEAKLGENQAENAMLDRMHRYYSKVFRKEHPELLPGYVRERTDRDTPETLPRLAPSAL